MVEHYIGSGMGKKKETVPKPSQITNKDVLQRMNFLFQASMLMQSFDSYRPQVYESQGIAQADISNKKDQNEKILNGHSPKRTRHPADISRFMVSSLRTISRKTVVPMLVLMI